MPGFCESCTDKFSDGRNAVKCGGFCSSSFCAKCCGLNDELFAAVINKSNLFWMCNTCKNIMDKARFRNALVSVESANQMVIEELKNSIRNDILEELKVEIRTNFKTLIDAVPKTPIPGPRQFSFNSAKRKRDNDDTGSNPSKLLRGTDAADSLTPSIAVNREDKKFWLYLSGISPDVPDESVTKLAADKLGNSNITVVKLVPRGRDPRTLNFVSYKVGMPTDLKEKAMTASTWPVGIAYREFEEKSDSRKVFWKPNAPDSATMTTSTALRPPPN
ncbi:uncharacterized protein LOC131677732 [Topomyia yanbarensis]|uniref:uncharacterized protein LOC131677732 n=1 Tax=Topomyia yanbarensis TaxID=2498891 RepID=UPI00273BFE43|nr:uncharacterized protein LOC131677732 [Topomyia yanbarensis]